MVWLKKLIVYFVIQNNLVITKKLKHLNKTFELCVEFNVPEVRNIVSIVITVFYCYHSFNIFLADSQLNNYFYL